MNKNDDKFVIQKFKKGLLMWFWRLKSSDYKKSITLAASEAAH